MNKVLKLSVTVLIIAQFWNCELINEPEWNNPFYPVIGPALILNPVEIVTKPNAGFSVSVRFEEIESVMGLHADVVYDSTFLVYNGHQILEEGTELLVSTGATLLYFVEAEPGRIQIDIGLATGSPAGISGSGDVVELRFTARLSGDTYLSFGSGCRITDQDLNDIPIFQTRGGAVYVK